MTRLHRTFGITLLCLFLMLWAVLKLRPIQLQARGSQDMYYDTTDESGLQLGALPPVLQALPKIARQSFLAIKNKLKENSPKANPTAPGAPGALGAIRVMNPITASSAQKKKQIVRYVSATQRKKNRAQSNTQVVRASNKSAWASQSNVAPQSNFLSGGAFLASAGASQASLAANGRSNTLNSDKKNGADSSQEKTAREWYELLANTPDKKTIFEFITAANKGTLEGSEFIQVTSDLIRSMKRSQAQTALIILQSTSSVPGFSLLVEIEMRYSSDEVITESLTQTYKAMAKSLAHTVIVSRALSQTENAFVQISALNVLYASAKFFSQPDKKSETPANSNPQNPVSTAPLSSKFISAQADAVFKGVRDLSEKTAQLAEDRNVIEKSDRLTQYIDSVLGTSQSVAVAP